ncbi:MAG: ROK family transcriptional regulator [Bryobacterales bacterium]|nr:ROK family transcriptional regulator [Bryobacterales bacterium]
MPTVSFTTSGALGKSALRQANERLVLNAIRREPGISRAEIGRTTGLARTSVTFLVNRLLHEKLVVEDKVDSGPAASAGRPPTSLQLVAGARLAVGVQVSRSRSRAMLVDLVGAKVAEREIAWHSDPAVFLQRLAAAIRDVTAGHASRQILGIGISLPGTIDKAAGRVIGAEGLGWFNVDVGETLARHLPWRMYFENDANLAALAEQWYLPAGAEPLRYFVYIQAEGGLGTGVVVDGRVLHGAASASAEFGHVMLDPEGRPCRCGNRGCWEQYASDTALLRHYAAAGGETLAPEHALTVVERAQAGDAIARHALLETARWLALGIVNLVAVLNPQAIILGEPYASAWDLVHNIIEEELRRRIPAYSLSALQLRRSREGREATLRGAAALVLAGYFTSFDHMRHHSLPNGVVVQANP